MTLILEFQPETQRKLETLATKNEQDMSRSIRDLIEEKIQKTSKNPYAG